MKKILNPLFITLIFISLSSCEKKTTPVIPITVVAVATVESDTVPIFIETLGHFNPFNTVTIQAQVEGVLEGLYFDEGHAVESGALLFTIDPRTYQAELDKAIAILKQNEANLGFAEDKAIRYSPLVEDDFVSQLDFDEYISNVALYDAMVEENIASIDKAQIDLGYCTIVSPISGITGKRLVDPGNLIMNAGTDLLVINQITPLFVDFSVPERDFHRVQKYYKESILKIEVRVPNTDLTTEANLAMIDNTVNPNTGMVALRGVLENLDKEFWPGQFVRVRLILYHQENALVVPNAAINPGQEGTYVWYVNKDSEVEVKYVELGTRFDDKIIIKKGIKVGDQVVIKGQLNLRPKAKVKIVKPKTTPPSMQKKNRSSHSGGGEISK